MDDKDAIGCVGALALLCVFGAIAVLVGRWLGAAVGVATMLLLMGGYLLACVVVNIRKDKGDKE